MGLTLSQVTARITALEDALSSGQLQVGYEDKTVRYRDFADMQATLEWLKSKEAELGGTRARPRQIRMVTRDGYGSIKTQQ